MGDGDVGGDKGDGTNCRGVRAYSTDVRGIRLEKGRCVEDGGVDGRRGEKGLKDQEILCRQKRSLNPSGLRITRCRPVLAML